MEQVFKSYLIVFLLFLGVFSFIGIISADMDVSRAKMLHADIVDEIENSHFSPSVISACQSTVAEKTDYQLEICEIADADGRTVMAEVILTYDYAIPFLGMKSRGHEIRGFAR